MKERGYGMIHQKEEILKLKKEKNAIILAHYYVEDEVQELADFVGDSYFLAKIAKETTADVIVFCGVLFMGESAKILNPDKMVLLPKDDADCPMAHMASISEIKKIKETTEDLAVVCYINSSAELKSVSDVCVTSSNALKIVNALKEKNILFIPDKNLGNFCKKQISDKNFLFLDGYCPIHQAISQKDLEKCKETYPNAKVLAHPECTQEVLNLADFIGSTSAIIDYGKNDKSLEYIIATEIGILYEMRKNNPEKKYHTITQKQICTDMKKITVDSVLEALKEEKYIVEISNDLAQKALKPLNKMLELAK